MLVTQGPIQTHTTANIAVQQIARQTVADLRRPSHNLLKTNTPFVAIKVCYHAD